MRTLRAEGRQRQTPRQPRSLPIIHRHSFGKNHGGEERRNVSYRRQLATMPAGDERKRQRQREETDVGQPGKQLPHAVHVPRVWVERRHLQWVLVLCRWELDGGLTARPELQLTRPVEVNDVYPPRLRLGVLLLGIL